MVTATIYISAILAIVLGVLVLIWPKILRFVLGIYLILFGVLQLVKF